MNLYFYKDSIEAGIDEVARGCLFGRVYSAAVIWPNEENEISCHPLIKDSKKLDQRKRLMMSDFIKENAISYSISFQGEEIIDQINILNATYKCMHLAIDNLKIDVDNLLVDGNKFKPYISPQGDLIPHQCIIKGDNNYFPIACASILAKVEHDQYIMDLCDQNEELNEFYDLRNNVGYGTKNHISGIQNYGLSNFHRKTFGICKNYV